MYQVNRKEKPLLSYQTRLRNYEAEKRELMEQGITPREYERLIVKIAEKWMV